MVRALTLLLTALPFVRFALAALPLAFQPGLAFALAAKLDVLIGLLRPMLNGWPDRLARLVRALPLLLPALPFLRLPLALVALPLELQPPRFVLALHLCSAVSLVLVGPCRFAGGWRGLL